MNKRHRSLSASSSSSSSSSSSHPPSRPPSPPSHKLFRSNDPSTSSDSTWTCSLPPTCSSSRGSTFSSPAEFEAHHRQFHRIVCHATQTQGGHGKGKERECGCVFPEQRMLDLHHREFHDPLIAIQRDRGIRIYECLLEPSLCSQKFKNPKGRRLHLIDSHQYPKEYYFAVVKHGIGNLLQSGGSSASLIQPRPSLSYDSSISPTALPYTALPALSPANPNRPLPSRDSSPHAQPSQPPQPFPASSSFLPKFDSNSAQPPSLASTDKPSSLLYAGPKQLEGSVDELVDIMSSASLEFIPRAVSKKKATGKKMVS